MKIDFVNDQCVTANGKPIEAKLPCTLEEFLVAQKLLPRSVVVEHNGVTSNSKRVKQAP
jgi:sulfur carrier protein ThiS